MKTLALLSALAITMAGSAQSLQFTFERWRDMDLQEKIITTTPQLLSSLNRTGFTNADSINVRFHQPREYVVVRHNVTGQERIDRLYQNVVIHAMLLETVARHSRMERFRIYVRLEANLYLQTEFDDLELKGKRVRINDTEFGF